MADCIPSLADQAVAALAAVAAMDDIPVSAKLHADRLHILQHSLGLDEHGRGKSYRNHYVAGKGHHSWDALLELEAAGLMERWPETVLSGGDPTFCVTAAGRAYVREHSPPPPKLTRSQQRYERYLDADSGLTFKEWLRCERKSSEEVADGASQREHYRG